MKFQREGLGFMVRYQSYGLHRGPVFRANWRGTGGNPF